MNIKTASLFRAALAVVILSPASAFAQTPVKMGLVMGTPSSVSFLWAFNDRVAIRPELGLTSASSTNSDTWSATPGFSALIYLKKVESLRTYFSPRYTYLRQHNSTTLPPALGGGTIESTSTTHSVAGSFGAEYALHRHFGVFGEVGLLYQRQPAAATWQMSNRTGLGAILYF